MSLIFTHLKENKFCFDIWQKESLFLKNTCTESEMITFFKSSRGKFEPMQYNTNLVSADWKNKIIDIFVWEETFGTNVYVVLVFDRYHNS